MNASWDYMPFKPLVAGSSPAPCIMLEAINSLVHLYLTLMMIVWGFALVGFLILWIIFVLSTREQD